MGFTGWFKDPAMVKMLWMVIPIQLAVLVWGLRQTALEGKSYGGQLGAGTLMSIIGGAILILSAYLYVVVFPNYYNELREMQIQFLQNQGSSPGEIDAAVETIKAEQTPTVQALFQFVSTVVLGFFASLILAAFIRKKAAPAA
jgi:hypothetical protein